MNIRNFRYFVAQGSKVKPMLFKWSLCCPGQQSKAFASGLEVINNHFVM